MRRRHSGQQSPRQSHPKSQHERGRRFVEAGGTVLADLRPGVFDEHVKPVPGGQLDDLFGIRRQGSPVAPLQDDLLDLATGESTEVFRSEAPYYEVPVDFLGEPGTTLLTTPIPISDTITMRKSSTFHELRR